VALSQASGPGGGRPLSSRLSPFGRIRLAKRAALRRRYAWAALRILRRGIRAAMLMHRERQIDGAFRGYSTTTEELGEAYAAALKALRKKWPRLDLADPRAELEREW
jgi:hypothetical protein